MNPNLVAYLIAVPVFVAIDLIWLMGPGRPLYVTEMGKLLRSDPNIAAAIAFYLLYGVGLVFFAISGAVQAGTPQQALWHGLLFGLIAYATYDLTGLSVINGFTLKIATIDMIWGALVSGITAYIAANVTSKLI